MMSRAVSATVLTGVILLAFAGAGGAGDNERFSTELTLEMQVDAEGGERSRTLVTGKAETMNSFWLAPDLSLNVGLVFQSLGTASDGEDRFFDSHGLILEQAYLTYEAPGFEAFLGKFNPRFGRAWSEMPGIYGDGFAKDYEFVEALGAGLRFHLGQDGPENLRLPGEQEIELSVYRSDTSIASDSLFYSRGRTALADGGAANTPGLSSVALTWEGSGLPGPDLEYNLGVSYRAGGRGDPRDEIGLVAGVKGTWAIAKDLDLRGVAEVAHFWNAEAERQDQLNTSLGATLVFRDNWRLVFAYGRRDVSSGSSPGMTDHLFETGGGYRFDNGIGLDVGYVATREEGEWTRGVGLLASYSSEF